MGIKLLAIAGAIGGFPAVALAQQSSPAPASPPATSAGTQSTRTTVTTSTGAVVSTSVVTPAMLKAQQDPNLIGSPLDGARHGRREAEAQLRRGPTAVPAPAATSARPRCRKRHLTRHLRGRAVLGGP